MSADFDSFGEAFQQLQDAMKGPPGGKKMPVWVKYVDVKAGDKINYIIRTGLEMHAACTGQVYHDCDRVIYRDVPSKFIKDILDDIKSKSDEIYSAYCNKYFSNDNSFVELEYNFGENESDLVIDVYTLDYEFFNYIKNNVDFHLKSQDDMKEALR